jgi:hypothetical protein
MAGRISEDAAFAACGKLAVSLYGAPLAALSD